MTYLHLLGWILLEVPLPVLTLWILSRELKHGDIDAPMLSGVFLLLAFQILSTGLYLIIV